MITAATIAGPVVASALLVGLVMARRGGPPPPPAPVDLVQWAISETQSAASRRPDAPARAGIRDRAAAALSGMLDFAGAALVAPSLRAAATIAQRLDSVSNALTGLGTLADKGQAGRPSLTRAPLDAQELASLYRYNGYAARFVDVVADDATRKGWTVTSDDSDDGADVFSDDNRRLAVEERIGDALRWARLYGGAAIMLVTDDAATRTGDPSALAQPLDLETLQSVQALVVLDGNEITPCTYETDPRSLRFREPATWLVSPNGQGMASGFISREVHASRILYIPGRKLPPSLRFQGRNGLDESVLEAVWDQVRNLTTTDQGAAILAQELKVDTLKVSGMANLATSDEQEKFFTTKLRGLLRSQSLLNMRVLDSGDEYTSEATNVTGYRDLSEGARTALAAVTAMPQTILFGEAPAGLNADGDSSRKVWDKAIAVVQAQRLMAPLLYLYLVLYSAADGPTGGQVPESWDLTFNPLDEQTEGEEAATRKVVAETDAIYIAAQVLPPEHVARSRFGPKGWQPDVLPLDDGELDDDFATLERARAAAGELKATPTGGELEATEPTPTAEADVQKTALNGAQVTAAAALVKSVATGALPREAVVGMLQVFFSLSTAEADVILGTVGAGFVPASTAPATEAAPFEPTPPDAA